MFFDDVRGTDFGRVGIGVRIAQAAPLPQQIPALIQFRCYFLQTLDLLVAQVLARIELVFLFCKLVDMF